MSGIAIKSGKTISKSKIPDNMDEGKNDLYCGRCGDYTDDEYPCDDCGKVYFCYNCMSTEKKYTPLLMCERCSVDYSEAMEEYDEDSERAEIGYRQGGLDPYKNDEEEY